MKSVRLSLAAVGALCASIASGQANKTTDTYKGPPAKAPSVTCSLKQPDGNSFEHRASEYERCVHDHMGPEADKDMRESIKVQGAYERAVAAADHANITSGAREAFIKNHMQAEGVTRK